MQRRLVTPNRGHCRVDDLDDRCVTDDNHDTRPSAAFGSR
jgi:hypothetical protein